MNTIGNLSIIDNMENCPFCCHQNRCCGHQGPKGYLCCRKEEHDGKHVACGGDGNHKLDEWWSDPMRAPEKP